MKNILLSLVSIVGIGFITNSYALNLPLGFINPYVAEAPPNAKALAAYVQIKNLGNNDTALASVSSPDFEKVEIHSMSMENGVMHMAEQKNLSIPANSEVILKSGGLHIMLINPKRALKAGDSVEILFTEQNNTTHLIDAQVKRIGAHNK
ncbi:MAG: copper chaperone PCu(A)C [Gammaproteobacteria bacterium]|nr:copper chaperone PCu(A)C [Gammaproteobacteria bacterium]